MTITKTTNTTTRYNKQQTTNNKTIRVFNFGFSILLLLKKTPNSIEKFKIKLLFLKQKKKNRDYYYVIEEKPNKLGPNP